MTLVFIINTPSQAYTWRHTITRLQEKGHVIKILARNYGSTPELVRGFGFPYDTFEPVGSGVSRLIGVAEHLRKCYVMSRRYSPSMVIGFGVDAALSAFLQRKPCVVFVDDETTVFQNKMTHAMAKAIVTPNTFAENLGRKHIPVNSYKELTYLHPAYFKPDPAIFDELKIGRGDRYVILRFNAFDAIHDIGIRGFTLADKIRLAQDLGKYARVFVSHEGNLPPELADLRLRIATNRIHHALFYAQLLVSDTQTMTTEAAVLGTPAVRSNSFVGPHDMHNFVELEKKYDLIYSFANSAEAIRKANELIAMPDLKERWSGRRNRMIAEKLDLTQFMMDTIEKHLKSPGKKKIARGQS
jgi:predicted glycosyltransferase